MAAQIKRGGEKILLIYLFHAIIIYFSTHRNFQFNCHKERSIYYEKKKKKKVKAEGQA